MAHIKYMHRIHALCIFRVNGSIYAKWKQYLTSPDWSRPILIMPAESANKIAEWCPPTILQAFQPGFITSCLNWLHKLGLALSERPSDSRHQELEQLATIVSGQRRNGEILQY